METPTPRTEIDALLEELRQGRPLAPLSCTTYGNAMKSWWGVFAATRALPGDLGDLKSPLDLEDLEDLIEAARSGELRRNCRAGAKAAELAGTPLAPNSLDVLMAALRRAHLQAGLVWNGESAHIRALIAAYARDVDHQPVKARPIELDEARATFASVLADASTPAGSLARVRAVASQLGVSIALARRIEPEDITWDEHLAVVDVGAVRHQTPCLRTLLDDSVMVTICAHCLLAAWKDTAQPAAPLLSEDQLATARKSAKRVCGALGADRAVMRRDRFVIGDGPERFWTLFAIAVAPDVAAWLRARALMLPMLAVGLRLDDLDSAPRLLQRIAPDAATLTFYTKGSDGAPVDVPLIATGGPLCPVRALWTYDRFVTAFLADRRLTFVPCRGRLTSCPLDVAPEPSSRATYQFLRIWLLEHWPRTAEPASSGVRATVTPHSSRRTFAQDAEAQGHDPSEIQRALRHTKPTTTAGYLSKKSGALAVPTNVLHRLSDERNGR